MVQVAANDIEVFRAGFGGNVVAPEDADYDTVRQVWNGNIDRRPALIARCTTSADVATAIAFARAHNLEVTVRGGGHNFSGAAVIDGALMVDLSLMRGVEVDAPAKRARVQGGATWADLDAATQAFGLATVGGFISHTGVGGLTLGGGMGWLTRKAGLSVDNLVGVEIVTADGQVLHASADEHADLFWAVRGGGGNFGVVTEFEFQLHEVGPLVNLGLFFWDVPHGRDALRFARDFIKTVPEEYGTFIAGLSAPPAPFVPAEYQGQPGFATAVVGFGTPEEHAAAIAPLLEAMPPSWALVTPIPYASLQQMFDDSAAHGVHGYEKAVYLDELSDEVIDLLVDFIPRKQSPLTFTPIFDLSNSFSRTAEADTAFGGTRQAGLALNITAICPGPELFEAERAWVREFWDAVVPYARGAGSYVNFMADYEEDRIRAAYGAEKLARLQRIKAQYDPMNVFHHNANIKPA